MTSVVDPTAERDRGREATRPGHVPLRGWKDVLVRTKRQMKADDVPLLSAGVAFFGLLALVPSLVALVSVYGLVADPDQVGRSIDDLLAAAPREVRSLVSSQLSDIVSGSPSGLRLGVLLGLVVALWSASSGIVHLIGAVTLAYDEEESRGFVRLRGVALVLTVAAVGVLAVVVAGLIVAPAGLSDSGAEGLGRALILVLRWPLLGLVGLAGLAVLYRFGPDRDAADWRWVTPGSLLAVVVWVLASIGFSVYVSRFGSYNETYGSLGAVVVLMLWLYISAYVVIAGAELNAELERQTRYDTTRGRDEPLGRRGAYAADTIGPSTSGGRS
jgi:membrane protein